MFDSESSGQELDLDLDIEMDVEVEAVPRGEPDDVEGCFTRGIIFASGREVEINLVEAHKWFNIAASRGHGEGVLMRREIAALMSDAEIGQAQRAARDWLKGHPLPAMPAVTEVRAAA
jgi:TPR repeat protein